MAEGVGTARRGSHRFLHLGLAVALLAACGAEGPADAPQPRAPASRTAESGGPAPPVLTESTPWLVDVTAEWGLDFVHDPGAVEQRPAAAIMGSGVALFDCDLDGDLDAFLAQADASTEGGRLFRWNEGRFQDATAMSGLGESGFAMGVAVGDIDNDGDEDLYVTHLGSDRLYRNDGSCAFDDVTAAAGVDVEGWSSSAAFCDLNLDGFLDLFVARDVVLEAEKECRDSAGRLEFCGPESFPDAQDVLLFNRGDGTFREATAAAGISSRTGSGLGVVCQDLSGDGWPDVYVANDADPNQFWVNQGDGTFVDEAVMLGAGVNAQGFPEAGMGVVAADLDGDLDLDLFLTHLEDESNTLYRNLGGDRGYDDVTFSAGLAKPSMSLTGFGTLALDLDQDGVLDLAVVNGKVKRGRPFDNALSGLWKDYAEPNLLFRGIGGGSFVEMPAEGGDFVATVEISRGLSTGDLDGDGDLDLLISNTAGPARVYRNDAPSRSVEGGEGSRHWLLIDPIDPTLGRRAIGATVRVQSAESGWFGVSTAAGSYLSSRDSRVHFGLGSVSSVDWVEVTWPGGPSERFPGGPVDRVLTLERGSGASIR